MPKRVEQRGKGLTKRKHLVFERSRVDPDTESSTVAPLPVEEQAELDAAVLTHTFEGRLALIEAKCAPVLAAAGLPTTAGNYFYDDEGAWEIASELGRGLHYTENIWTIAERRAVEHDSAAGFAARMVDYSAEAREAREGGNLDRAAMMMFYLGAQAEAWRIGRQQARESIKRAPRSSGERDKEAAKEYQRRRADPAKAHVSNTELKKQVGEKKLRTLGPEGAIKAINRGLKNI